MDLKITPKRNHLANIDWFDEQFTTDFLFSDYQIKEELNKKQFRLSDKNISSRVITHWHNMKILDDDREDRKGWRKYSLSEVLWIQIIKKLRSFGVDLDKIKKVKDYLDTYNSKDNKSKCPLFDFYIVGAMQSSMPFKLIVFYDGEALLGKQYDIDTATQLGLIQEDYIDIDLTSLVSKVMKSRKSAIDYTDYALTEIEKEVNRAIHFEEVESLSIKSKGQYFYLTTEHVKETREEISQLLKKAGSHFKEGINHKGSFKQYTLQESKKIKRDAPNKDNEYKTL